MSKHRVEWRISGDSIYGTLICDEPPGAPCHLVCPEGCEFAGCEHGPGIDRGYCNAVEWIHNDGRLEEFYDSTDEHPVVDGPVEVSWDWQDQCWKWVYEDEGRAT